LKVHLNVPEQTQTRSISNQMLDLNIGIFLKQAAEQEKTA
jgi:hypothetical protein